MFLKHTPVSLKEGVQHLKMLIVSGDLRKPNLCSLVLGCPPSSPFQPDDEAAGSDCVCVGMVGGHQSSGSHAGLQPYQGWWQPHPVLLLHVLQRGVPRHHHPSGYASCPDCAGVHHPHGFATVLLHSDLHFPQSAEDGKTQQSA